MTNPTPVPEGVPVTSVTVASGAVVPAAVVTGDGSKNLLPESAWGHAVQLLISAIALAVAGWLGSNLPLDTLPGWATSFAAVALATVAGLLTSWAKSNIAKNE